MPSTARTTPSRVKKFAAEIVDFDQGHYYLSFVRGSSASRRQSAMNWRR
jgi:hypothetical protein